MPRFPLLTAHPRVCGENDFISAQGKFVHGSSPRMRGKLFGGGQITEERGLIPAYAGKTLIASPIRNSRPAHPRVCGENYHLNLKRLYVRGSSPRMRGKLWQ